MIKTSGIAGAGKLADIFFRYSTSVILTRILGTKVFGEFVLARSITWIVSAIGQMGMGLGLVKEIPYYTAKNDEDKYRQIIRLALLVCSSVSLVAAALLYLNVDYLSLKIFNKPGLVFPLRLLTFTIPVITISYTLLDALRGFKRIRARVWVENYFLPLANLLMVTVLFFLGYRLEGVLGAFILSNVFSFIVLILINREKIKIVGTPFLEKRVAYNFLKFSFPLMLVKILGELRTRLDVLLLGFLSTASNVGIFFIAMRLANLMSVPWQATNTIVAPMVSGYFARGDLKTIEYNYKNVTKLIFIPVMFFWGFLVIFSKELLSIFGAQFKDGAAVVILICFGQLVKSLVGHSGPMLAMIGKPSINLLVSIVTLAIMALLNLFFVPRLGITGAGIANLSGVTISGLMELYFIYRFLHLHPFRWDFFKPVTAALVSGGIIYLLKTALADNFLSIIFLMTAFTGFYFFFLYLQKLTAEEILLLEKLKEKLPAVRKIKKK